MRYSVPKGLFDIVPQEPKATDAWRCSARWQHLEKHVRQLAHDYGYSEIRTPMFERTELFVRGMGESSDIVSKEMYTFNDKADRSMTLRPEGTAPVMRAFVEKGLHQLGQFHKFFYIGPYFRYDRPQAGRYRQFHQFGVEAIGDASPEQDAEVIAMLADLYTRLGLQEWTVLLNTVGDSSCRAPYREALKNYLKPHFEKLSEDSQTRFNKNPLRILDSKDRGDQDLLKNAPSIHDYLSPASKVHFDSVCKHLDALLIPYSIAPNLVRGLDYYNQTVFEITATALGAQNSLGGGGRFDGLLDQLGGPDLPSTGFACGLERILLTMDAQKCTFDTAFHPFVFVVPLGDNAFDAAYQCTFALRREGIPADIAPKGRKVQKALQLADQKQATYALVLGDDEIQSGTAKLKHLQSRREIDIKLDALITTCEKLYANN